MTNIFISYRRSDSLALTGRIYDRLSSEFGQNVIYMDIDTIPLGVDFRKHLQEAVTHSKVLVAIIGQQWLDTLDSLSLTAKDSTDFVRIEIETALNNGIPVIPVLIDNATMPTEQDLPKSLADFAYRNALIIDTGRDFHYHINRLIASLRDFLDQSENRSMDRPLSVDNKQISDGNSQFISHKTIMQKPKYDLPHRFEDTVVDNLICNTIIED